MLMKTPEQPEIEPKKVWVLTAQEKQTAERERQKIAEQERKITQAGPKWYILQCIRATDNQALEAFGSQSIRTYYPKIIQLKPMPRNRMSASQRHAGMTIQVPTEVALFPRYLFLHMDFEQQRFRTGFDLKEVGGFLSRDVHPIYLPDEVINSIKGRENNGIIPGKDSLRAVFSIGDKVTVTNGPFASFPGIVEEGLDVAIEKLAPNLRIKVAVNIFGRATPVDLEYWQVAKQDD
jgi:transcriptional antiterminator NusG